MVAHSVMPASVQHWRLPVALVRDEEGNLLVNGHGRPRVLTSVHECSSSDESSHKLLPSSCSLCAPHPQSQRRISLLYPGPVVRRFSQLFSLYIRPDIARLLPFQSCPYSYSFHVSRVSALHLSLLSSSSPEATAAALSFRRKEMTKGWR